REDADDRERDREVREPAPSASQLLLVAEFGELLLVRARRASVGAERASGRAHRASAPFGIKRFGSPSFIRDNTLESGLKSRVRRKSPARSSLLRSIAAFPSGAGLIAAPRRVPR